MASFSFLFWFDEDELDDELELLLDEFFTIFEVIASKVLLPTVTTTFIYFPPSFDTSL